MQELRLAVRTLGRVPGFAATAIVTLALGIGASTAIFSVAYGVSLRPLPYPEPERLVRLYESNPANGLLEQDVSVGAFHDWREGAPAIESAALFTKAATRYLAQGREPVSLAHGREPVRTMSVSPAFFGVLGVVPMLGGGFGPEGEYTRVTANREAIISHGAWQRLFGGRADIIGQSIAVAGVGDHDAYRIVGVMPASFAFDEPVDLWRPTKLVETPVPRLLRTWRYDRVVARLRPGASMAQARTELETVAARLARDYPTVHAGWTVTVESLHESVVGGFGRATVLLLAAVAVVLLVACLNVGGLLLARAVSRGRETALRVALGAGLRQLLRLWLAEAALLGLLGGALGLLLAWSGVGALKAAAPPGIPRLDAIALDAPAVVSALVATALAILTFTAMPLRGASRQEVADGLRSRSAGGGEARGRHVLRTTLTVAQCAGAAALVVLAVMLTRSFVKLMSFDLGWDPQGVLSLTVDPPMPRELRRPWFRYVEWSDRLIRELEAAPGIERAAITTEVPLAPGGFFSTVARGRGRQGGDEARWPIVRHHVTNGYFALMQIPVVEGRAFRDADRFSEAQVNSTGKADHGVAVVSRSTARALWPGKSAIGETLWLPEIDNAAWREVVGVVDDLQFAGVGEAAALHVFVPWTQSSTGRPRLLVKGTVQANALTPLVRHIVQRVEPGTGIDQVAALDALVASATAQPRFTSRLVVAFGALALVLAAVGIYGTLSYVVGARRREFGIRLALGASRARVIALVVRRGVMPALAGGFIGLAAAVGLAQTFRALLFDVDPVDIVSVAAGAILLAIVALTAALGPARRASRVDPVEALRSD